MPSTRAPGASAAGLRLIASASPRRSPSDLRIRGRRPRSASRTALLLALVLSASVAAQPSPAWVPLGAGAQTVAAPVHSDMDAAGNVYAVQFPPGVFGTELARWNGTSWTVLPGQMPHFATGVAVTEAGDALYVSFTTTATVTDGSGASVTLGRVGRYDIATATWDDLDGGLDLRVSGLDADAAGNLIVAGEFTQSGGGTPLSNAARWNVATGQWESLGGGVDGWATAVTVESGGTIVVGGNFDQATNAGGGTVAAGGIARFDPASGTWTSLGTGFDVNNRTIRGIVSDGTAVTVIGGILRVGGVGRQVYRWTGASWIGYAAPAEVAVNPNRISIDAAGTVYVSGSTFSTAFTGHSVHARAVGASGWTALALAPRSGAAFQSMSANPAVAGTRLFLGGRFFGFSAPSGTVSAANFAIWDGAVWSSVQPPFVGVTGAVHAVEERLVFGGSQPGAPRQVTRTIVAGGDFSDIAGAAVEDVAINDGTGWRSLGGGVSDPNGVVRAVLRSPTLGPDVYSTRAPVSTPVIVGGTFTEVANGDGSVVPVSNVAQWFADTDAWVGLGGGVSRGGVAGTGVVHAIAYAAESRACASHPALDWVYVGGEFDTATNADGSTVSVRNLARYNLRTGRWASVQGGTSGPVYALEAVPFKHLVLDNLSGGLDAHTIYVGGRFAQVFDGAGTPTDVQNVAWLGADGQWRGFAGGTAGPVYALEVMTGHVFTSRGFDRCGEITAPDVYVGGAFTSVTSNGPQVPASNIALATVYPGGTQWTVLGRPFGQGAAGTPGNGVNGTVRSIRTIGPQSGYRSNFAVTLSLGGDFTEAYGSDGSIASAPRVAILRDEPAGHRVYRYEGVGGGMNGGVDDVAWTTCRWPTGDWTSTLYIGGTFTTVGNGITSAGLAKWRDFAAPRPVRVVSVSTGGRRHRCRSGSQCSVAIVPVWQIGCGSPALGRTASGADDEIDLGAIAFGEVAVTPDAQPPADVPVALVVRDPDGTVLAQDTLVVDTEAALTFVLTGVDDPGGFAPNPDGRDVRLGVRPVQMPVEAPPDSGLVRVLHAVTDAPALSVTLPDGTLVADSVAFDSLGAAVALPLGPSELQVRRHADGVLLGTLDLELTEAEPVQVATLSGFLDPSANQDGPGLTLVAAPVSQRAPVTSEEAPEADGWRLLPVAPNPVAASGTVGFVAPEAGAVTVDVLDALGRRVAVLHEGPVAAGSHAVPWSTRGLAGGVYLVRLRAGGRSLAQSVTVLR